MGLQRRGRARPGREGYRQILTEPRCGPAGVTAVLELYAGYAASASKPTAGPREPVARGVLEMQSAAHPRRDPSPRTSPPRGTPMRRLLPRLLLPLFLLVVLAPTAVPCARADSVLALNEF